MCRSGEATGHAMTPDCVCERCLRTAPMSIRACRTWSNTGGGAHPAGRSGCPGRLHPSSQPGQGALRLTNDQGRTAQNVPICVAYTASHDVGKPPRTTVRAHVEVAVCNSLAFLSSCDHGHPPGGCGRQAELLPAGVDHLAAPAIYAATMYVACRSRLPRARSYRIVVLGSACEAASWTSRSGTPASSAAVMNACLSVCGVTA